MTRGKFRRRLAILLAMQVTAGCGYIKSWFPDKERDYQFRSEIPELVVPEDLKNKTLPERTPEQVAAAAVAESEVKEQPVAEPKVPETAAKHEEPAAKGEEQTLASVAASNSGVSSLQIDQPRMQAWRLVARALSRQRVEIVERNIDKSYFYVKYDPNATKPEDGSIWDEVTFLFGDDPSHEKEYRISLMQIAPEVSEVTIQDNEGKTLSDSVAANLLKLITDGINQGLPEKTPDNPSDSEPAPR